jgi:hypothetical protein
MVAIVMKKFEEACAEMYKADRLAMSRLEQERRRIELALSNNTKLRNLLGKGKKGGKLSKSAWAKQKKRDTLSPGTGGHHGGRERSKSSRHSALLAAPIVENEQENSTNTSPNPPMLLPTTPKAASLTDVTSQTHNKSHSNINQSVVGGPTLVEFTKPLPLHDDTPTILPPSAAAAPLDMITTTKVPPTAPTVDPTCAQLPGMPTEPPGNVRTTSDSVTGTAPLLVVTEPPTPPPPPPLVTSDSSSSGVGGPLAGALTAGLGSARLSFPGRPPDIPSPRDRIISPGAASPGPSSRRSPPTLQHSTSVPVLGSGEASQSRRRTHRRVSSKDKLDRKVKKAAHRRRARREGLSDPNANLTTSGDEKRRASSPIQKRSISTPPIVGNKARSSSRSSSRASQSSSPPQSPSRQGNMSPRGPLGRPATIAEFRRGDEGMEGALAFLPAAIKAAMAHNNASDGKTDDKKSVSLPGSPRGSSGEDQSGRYSPRGSGYASFAMRALSNQTLASLLSSSSGATSSTTTGTATSSSTTTGAAPMTPRSSYAEFALARLVALQLPPSSPIPPSLSSSATSTSASSSSSSSVSALSVSLSSPNPSSPNVVNTPGSGRRLATGASTLSDQRSNFRFATHQSTGDKPLSLQEMKAAAAAAKTSGTDTKEISAAATIAAGSSSSAASSTSLSSTSAATVATSTSVSVGAKVSGSKSKGDGKIEASLSNSLSSSSSALSSSSSSAIPVPVPLTLTISGSTGTNNPPPVSPQMRPSLPPLLKPGGRLGPLPSLARTPSPSANSGGLSPLPVSPNSGPLRSPLPSRGGFNLLSSSSSAATATLGRQLSPAASNNDKTPLPPSPDPTPAGPPPPLPPPPPPPHAPSPPTPSKDDDPLSPNTESKLPLLPPPASAALSVATDDASSPTNNATAGTASSVAAPSRGTVPTSILQIRHFDVKPLNTAPPLSVRPPPSPSSSKMDRNRRGLGMDDSSSLRHNSESRQRVTRLMANWKCDLEHVVEHPWWDRFFVILIVINAALLASEHYRQPSWWTQTLAIANLWFAIFFLIEIILKIIGKGCRRFVHDTFNLFDLLVVCTSMGEIIASIIGEGFADVFTGQVTGSASKLTVFRVIRLFRLTRALRVMKVIKHMPQLRKIISVINRTTKTVGWVLVLILLMLFIFSIVGMQLFGGKISRNDSIYNFDTFDSSLLFMFITLSGEDWPHLMYLVVEVCHSLIPLHLIANLDHNVFPFFVGLSHDRVRTAC